MNDPEFAPEEMPLADLVSLEELKKCPGMRQFPTIVKVLHNDLQLGGPFAAPRVTFSLQFRHSYWPIWEDACQFFGDVEIIFFHSFEDAFEYANKIPLESKIVFRIVLNVHLLQ